jgi:hypothetical protein
VAGKARAHVRLAAVAVVGLLLAVQQADAQASTARRHSVGARLAAVGIVSPPPGVQRGVQDDVRLAGPAYPRHIASIVPLVPTRTAAPFAGITQTESRSGGCVVAVLGFGLAGLVLGNAGTAAFTDGPAIPLLAGAAGTVAGMKVGSLAARCQFSAWGGVVGVGLAVVLGATGGNAFGDNRTESDDDAIWAANLLMVPLASLGSLVAGLISSR